MTYKNIKFDESPIMRSLEKLAIKNGTFKPEEIKKTASSKPSIDLSPTKDFTQNILKLCSGLRLSGFNKYADDIEVKYFNLKQANTSLYDMMKETGEDLINQAHPDGSPTLKSVEGDATVETIVDQAKQIRNIINKKPKGKLANKDIINMVKITLAQAQPSNISDIEQGKKKISLILIEVKKIISKVINKAKSEGISATLDGFIDLIDKATRDPKRDNLQELKEKLCQSSRLGFSLYSILEPGWIGGLSKDTWEIIKSELERVAGFLDNAIAIRSQILLLIKETQKNEEVLEDKTTVPADTTSQPITSDNAKIIADYEAFLDEIDNTMTIVEKGNDPNKTNILNYFQQIGEYITGQENKFKANPKNADVFIKTLNDQKGIFTKFKTEHKIQG